MTTPKSGTTEVIIHVMKWPLEEQERRLQFHWKTTRRRSEVKKTQQIY
jgi:hypothetical protein